MNYQTAKKIVDHPENYSDIGPLGWNQVHHANGYLEAYAKAQKLVEALERIEGYDAPDVQELICIARNVLTQWHKENKEGE